MKTNKTQMGITLVALIITIIVLLILAVVAIRAVQGDGIIAHAKNARDNYNRAQVEENGILQNYTDYITGQVEGGTTSSGLALSDIKIGDKVAYNEGYRADKKSDVDNNFTMDDMDWRVLDIDEASGTVKLISSRPTTSKLTLSGEQDWLDAETKLDKLCSDLYANGAGVTARSLKVEDINKLANYDPTTYSGYGSKYQYRYGAEAGYMQYRKSTDNGTTWNPDWTNITGSSYQKFKEPGKEIIDKDHATRTADLTDTYYNYSIASEIKTKTSDEILVSDLITKGLNNTNDAAHTSNISQWLSSRCVDCYSDYAYFGVLYMYSGGSVDNYRLWDSYGISNSPTYVVRPVVTLPSNVFTTKVNETWQVNL